MNLEMPSRTTLITVRNVEAALITGLHQLRDNHTVEQTRNGPCAVFPGPVVTEYWKPWERVLFNPVRNANPFFHFMESLWMLAGRNDVAFLSKFNSRIAQYSDNGVVFWGAYGHRWRKFFGADQLEDLIKHLHQDPNTRRAVLGMYSSGEDLIHLTKDVPCNTHAYVDLRNGKLNLTVCNRSNDMIWGAYGANAVHFSMLQQFLAEALGVEMGCYTQFSNNMHVYLDTYPFEKWQSIYTAYDNKYADKESMLFPGGSGKHAFYDGKHAFSPRPIIAGGADHALDHIEKFCEHVAQNEMVPSSLSLPIVADVALPMLLAWKCYKDKHMQSAVDWANQIDAADWRVACYEWLHRKAMAGVPA